MRTPLRLSLTVALALTLLSGCTEPPGLAAAAPESKTEALAQLDMLKIGTWHSMSGYSRDRFPHWRSQGNGCDTREVVLNRDGEGAEVDSHCKATSGRWVSPYDGKTFTDPSDLDIDHMVPLANAWRTGADAWTDNKRSGFANDLDRPQLVAVSASSNRAKGDQDPSQWRPPSRDYWCTYAQDWVQVKVYWHLFVTTMEKAALKDMLETC